MSVKLQEFSTITVKGQTTIPRAVRQILGVDLGGRIAFHADETGVRISRADADEDPAIEAFLSFLASDIQSRPVGIAPLGTDLIARINGLTRGLEIDPDDAIDGEVCL